jgi:hypothetical protein
MYVLWLPLFWRVNTPKRNGDGVVNVIAVKFYCLFLFCFREATQQKGHGQQLKWSQQPVYV